METIDYKFNEDYLISELKEYVDSTYSGHYSRNKFQATEFIIDSGHGMGFCIGNVLKYAQRYGHKEGYNRKDLLKVLHYALIALSVHDRDEQNRMNEAKGIWEDGYENDFSIAVDDNITLTNANENFLTNTDWNNTMISTGDVSVPQSDVTINLNDFNIK